MYPQVFPWILVVQTVLWVQVLPVKKPQVYCNNLDNNLLRIQYFYWCKNSMRQRVSFPEQWAYCCQTAFVLCVFYKDSTFSPLGPAGPDGPMGPGAPCWQERNVVGDLCSSPSLIINRNLCSHVSKQISFNKHWQVLSLYRYSISFGLRSCHTPLFTGELRLNVFAASQRCFTYSCAIIPSCTFRSFLTNCSLNKHNKWKSFAITLKRNVVMKKN